jgi:acetyl-CoA carboxylase biotin carboxyl carrier protein
VSELKAEMAATVWKIKVEVDTSVGVGDEVVILESMKMEIPVTSPVAGRVAAVRVTEGAVVNPGDVLLEINPS